MTPLSNELLHTNYGHLDASRPNEHRIYRESLPHDHIFPYAQHTNFLHNNFAGQLNGDPLRGNSIDVLSDLESHKQARFPLNDLQSPIEESPGQPLRSPVSASQSGHNGFQTPHQQHPKPDREETAAFQHDPNYNALHHLISS